MVETKAANKTSQATAVFAFLLVLSQVPPAPEFFRSATMRAERAQLKSRRDDMIVAPGKRSAARGTDAK